MNTEAVPQTSNRLRDSFMFRRLLAIKLSFPSYQPCSLPKTPLRHSVFLLHYSCYSSHCETSRFMFHPDYRCFLNDEKWQPWSALPSLFNAFLFKHVCQAADCMCVLTNTAAQPTIINKPLAKWNLHGLWLVISAMLYWCDDYKRLKRLWTRWFGELDQPVWSPLLPSLLSWLFPCELEIMTSSIWGLVVFERGGGEHYSE